MTPEKPIPAWKEQARGLVQEAILDAARSTFAERGYEGATIDEIAARAEVAKGTIYNYFEGGKAGLFVGVLSTHFDELQALAEQHLATGTPPLRERYQAFVASVIAYFHTHRDLLRVHLREVPQLLVADEGGGQAARLRDQRDRLVEVFAQAFAGAIEAGELRPVPVCATAHVALGTLLSHLGHSAAGQAREASDPEPCDGEANARFLTDLLFAGLLNYAGGDGSDRRPAGPAPAG